MFKRQDTGWSQLLLRQCCLTFSTSRRAAPSGSYSLRKFNSPWVLANMHSSIPYIRELRTSSKPVPPTTRDRNGAAHTRGSCPLDCADSARSRMRSRTSRLGESSVADLSTTVRSGRAKSSSNIELWLTAGRNKGGPSSLHGGPSFISA